MYLSERRWQRHLLTLRPRQHWLPAAPSQTFGLSPREMEVLRLMADGLSNRQVADALYVSLRTVATHVTSVLTKLDLPSRTAAVAFAIRNGLA